ncbi:MAG: HDOD domain-containing protein [Opitutales bacterium]|nr:HDOD domain-containing protein [Opitutales bacterium]
MNKPSDFLLIERINQCPKLASLKSINDTLRDLLDSEDSFVGQIAEVIRLDPSLTTRILDLVNSIFFGSKESDRISGVEEASIFLGLNRIKDLIAATPVIEEIFKLGKKSSSFPWVDFWKHSIGTAMLTREILSFAEEEFEQEADYVAGLLHNLGILILAITFPEHFSDVYKKEYNSDQELLEYERKIVGWDHGKIGAYYLWNHHISEEVVDSIHWHNQPSMAKTNPKLASAIQVADHIVRQLGTHGMENYSKGQDSAYLKLEGWSILFGEHPEEDDIKEKLNSSLERLNQTLNGVL